MSEAKDPDYNKILNLYAAFGAGLILTLVPVGLAAGISLLFITGTLIAAYVMRGQTTTNSLLDNHTTFIIRTIWIGSLYSILSVALGSVYMNSNLDFTPVEACAHNITDAAQAMMGTAAANPDAALMNLMKKLQPCIDEFLSANKSVLQISTLIAAAPILIYFGLRYVRGLSRALKGYRIAAPLNWF